MKRLDIFSNNVLIPQNGRNTARHHDDLLGDMTDGQQDIEAQEGLND